MRRFWMMVLLWGIAFVTPGYAQDGLNLPTELYILLNEGRVQRFGLGASGIQTITPEDAFILDFSVAPDGNWLAYRTPEGLFLRPIYGSDTDDAVRNIEGESASVPNTRGRGDTLAWSPDSSALAYTTMGGGRVSWQSGAFSNLDTPGLLNLIWSPDGRYLAAEAEQNIWWIFRREGNSMVLTSAITSGVGAAWLDETRMVFAPEEGGLVVMDMANNNAQTLLFDDFQRYRLPYVLADGRIHVFLRDANNDVGILLRISIEGEAITTEELGSNTIELGGLKWAPGGQLLLAFQGGALALVDPFSGAGFTLPITSASAYSWGPTYPPSQDQLSLPRPGFYIAPDTQGIAQVWRIAAEESLPATLTPALQDISEYSVGPNARRIVYVSESSLWLHIPPTTEAGLLTELGGAGPVNPAFSPDGRYVYYRDEQGAQRGIWRIGFDEDVAAEPELFVPDAEGLRFELPQPASGVSAMLLTTRSSQDGLVLLNTESGVQQLIGAYERAWWLRGSRLMVQGFSPQSTIAVPGLFLIDINDLSAAPISILPLFEDLRVLDVIELPDGQLRALTQSQEPGPVDLLALQADGSAPSRIGNIGHISSPQFSQDGTVVVGYTHQNGALMKIDLASLERQTLARSEGARLFSWP